MANFTHKFDVVVVGGGPNGLLAGAYLARAGKKVCILERRMEMGGGLQTEESNYGGVYHNTHAIYMPMIDYAPAIRDLEIETKHRVRFLTPEVQMCMVGQDGTSVSLYHDPERTAGDFARYSKKDAETFLKLAKQFQQWMDDFLGPYTYVQPKPTLEIAAAMHELQMGKEMFELTERTPKELVEEWFEDDRIRALLLNAICFWGLDPEQSGLGYLIPLYFNRSYNYRLVERGSHQLAQALMRDALNHGATLLTVQPIDRFDVQEGRICAVETTDGDRFEADVVVSTIDMEQTFLRYVGEKNLDPEFVDKVKLWSWEEHSYLSAYVTMDAPPPQLKSGKTAPELNKALIYIFGCEGVADYMAHTAAIAAGKVGEIMYASFPGALDGNQSRLEDKTAVLLQQHVPYELKEGKQWKEYNLDDKEQVAEEMITKMLAYVDNYEEDDVLASSLSTPVDIERKFLDMKRGSVKQGQYHPLQMGYMRPNDECSTHRSPIKGLYMGGACSYPGGTVLLANGFLAADAVCEDLGLEKWWGEPEIIRKAKAKGMPL